MLFPLVLFAVLSAIGAPRARSDEASAERESLEPKRYPFERYEQIWSARSPFELPQGPPPPRPPGPPPFKDYSLLGYSKRGTQVTVTLVHKKTKEREKLIHGEANFHGFELVSFKTEWNYRNTIVTVSKNGEVGEIGFEKKDGPKHSVSPNDPNTINRLRAIRSPRPRRVVLPPKR
jgi:hypothetical protein